MKKVLLFFIFAVSLSLILASLSFCMSQTPQETPGKFTLKDITGKKVSLESYKGKVVLMTFFTTWCPSCQDEVPALEGLYQKYRSRDFEVLGINIKDSPELVKAFARENKLTFPILLDDDGAIATQYKVRYIPRNFILGKDGSIKFTAHYMQVPDLEKEILKVMQ